jgi:hypothetical protein
MLLVSCCLAVFFLALTWNAGAITAKEMRDAYGDISYVSEPEPITD